MDHRRLTHFAQKQQGQRRRTDNQASKKAITGQSAACYTIVQKSMMSTGGSVKRGQQIVGSLDCTRETIRASRSITQQTGQIPKISEGQSLAQRPPHATESRVSFLERRESHGSSPMSSSSISFSNMRRSRSSTDFEPGGRKRNKRISVLPVALSCCNVYPWSSIKLH